MPSSLSKAEHWHNVAERGSLLGIRVLLVTANLFGRRMASLFLRAVAIWYFVLDGHARRASRTFRMRLCGHVSTMEVFRHIHCFAQVTLDRLFFLNGRLSPFQINIRGEEYLKRLTREKKGGLFILAHLGSFEVLRSLSEAKDYPMNILGYFGNAPLINSVLQELNPSMNARLITIRPDDPSFVFEIEERIRAGEMVGTMGDRVGLDGKSVRVPFLGADASFPTGPYLLASLLRCPVYLAFALFHRPNRYEIYCEPFAEAINLPRAGREAALRDLAARYAHRLEAYCRQAPDNWFNFFDFWAASEPAPTATGETP